MKQQIQKAFRRFGYEVHRVQGHGRASTKPVPAVPAINPIWPLPRNGNELSTQRIREEFAKYDSWHYANEFEGGLSFPRRYGKDQPAQDPNRPLQRFRHLMPHLLAAQNGSLQGKRVLDIACNSGFWSMQCALRGANVVGFDARPQNIEQANLVKRVVGIDNVEFKVLDFWDMSLQSLGGAFDIVLCLGFLNHLPYPIQALQVIKNMARKHILLDTSLYQSTDSAVELQWQQTDDIRAAKRYGIVAIPTKKAVELILTEIGVAGSFEIPIVNSDVPDDYREQLRGCWLITV
jgi:tRNA (mo5U34)-methyltransferase